MSLVLEIQHMSDFVTTSAGDRIAYDLRGSGPAVIFVAGAGPFRAIDPVTTQTAELVAQHGLATIVYDRLGRGESPAGGPLTLDRELASINALLEVAGGNAVLCGHSSGCSISLAAADRGLPVTGLALWEGPFVWEGISITEWAAEFERRLDAGELRAAVAQYMVNMPQEWVDQALNSPESIAGVVTQRSDAQSLAWVDLRDFSRIRVPLLYMLGTESFPEMFESADMVVESIPGAVKKRVPGAWHSWEPEAMASELVAFVTAAQ